jgi:hypothetical protein
MITAATLTEAKEKVTQIIAVQKTIELMGTSSTAGQALGGLTLAQLLADIENPPTDGSPSLIETTITTAIVAEAVAAASQGLSGPELDDAIATATATATAEATTSVGDFTAANDKEVTAQTDIVDAALSGPAISGAIATAETETGTVQVSATGETVTVDFNKSTLYVGGRGIKLLKGSSSGSRIAQLRRNAINQGIKNNSTGDNPKQFVTFSIMRNSLRRARSSGGGKQNAKKQT